MVDPDFEALAYSEVSFYGRMIFDEKSETVNNQLIASAFLAWLTTNTKKKRFNDYAKMLGLVEKSEPITEEQKQMLQERADNLAERILKADKKRKS